MKKTVTIKQINNAANTLLDYSNDKRTLEQRIIENEKFWEMMQWQTYKGKKQEYEPSSKWALNSMLNKHADIMDNYPQAVVFPRQKEDEEQAQMLNTFLPTIFNENEYESTYSDLSWNKLKYGTAVQGVFWNPASLGLLGNISIKNIDLLRIYWENGVADIQESENIFYITPVSEEELRKLYPKLKGNIDIGLQMPYTNETLANKKKIAIVDWYYKTYNSDGKKVLHYCKFAGDNIIFSSENQAQYAKTGFYEHGKYPFIFDTLYSIPNSPTGFGLLDLMKDTQMYIDKLNSVLLKHSLMAAKKRYFVRLDGGINEQEFANWEKDFVHVAGSLDNAAIREIAVSSMDDTVLKMFTQKIEELKETSGNRDFNQGSAAKGVTAASAISALQEAGNKLSRDIIKSAYRAFKKVTYMQVELIRQFYNRPHHYRYVNSNGKVEYRCFDNKLMQAQKQPEIYGIDTGKRLPQYDITIHALKSSPFSTVAQNELAKEFYRMGFFDAENADQALICLKMMDFEGKDEIQASILANKQRIENDTNTMETTSQASLISN